MAINGRAKFVFPSPAQNKSLDCIVSLKMSRVASGNIDLMRTMGLDKTCKHVNI